VRDVTRPIVSVVAPAGHGKTTLLVQWAERSGQAVAPSMSKEADAAAQRVTEFSDHMTELTKRNGLAWLGAYEKVLGNMLQLQQRAIVSSQIEWINALATTNANFMREMSAAYFKTVREGLK
jgi:hypothetical protein